MSTPYHGRATHGVNGTDRIVEEWIYVGTSGVDGAAAPDGGTAWEARLAGNPPPYSPADSPGPPPFVTGTNGFALDPDGNPGDGLRYRAGPNGIEIDCGGGITGLSPGDVITTLIGVDHALPDTAKRFIDSDDAGGAFTAILLPSGDLVYLGALGIDGGGP